jgi:hypothetical protein
MGGSTDKGSKPVGHPVRERPRPFVLLNSAQLATALGAAGVVYLLAGGHPGSGQVSLPAFADRSRGRSPVLANTASRR